MSPKRNLKGLTYGTLTWVEELILCNPVTDRYTSYWRFKCDCGRTGKVPASKIRDDRPRTCGELCLIKTKNKLAIQTQDSLAF